MITTRKYKLVGFVGNSEPFEKIISLSDLVKEYKDTWEYLYALQNELDLILDLGINQTMFVFLDRGNVDYKGVLIRVS